MKQTPLAFTGLTSTRSRWVAKLSSACLALTFISAVAGPPAAAAPAEPTAESATTEFSLAAVSSTRIAGDDRYDTAIDVARQVGGGSLTGLDRLIVATGEEFPDALVASGLAGYLDRCESGEGICGRTAILLTRQASLPPQVADAIRDSGLPATSVLIVGGPSAVSDETHAAIAQAAGWSGDGDNPVRRVYGQTRYETATAIVEYVRDEADGQLPESYETVLVANGETYPDALAGGALAYRNGHLTVLSRPPAVPENAREAITDIEATCAVILGGPQALSTDVSVQVDDSLTPGGCGTDRVGGANRFETAAMIADRMKETNGSVTEVVLASGQQFTDALVAAPLAAGNTPILFTAPGQLSAATMSWLQSNRHSITQVTVVGGAASLPASVVNAAVVTATPPLSLPAPAGGNGSGAGTTPSSWPAKAGSVDGDEGNSIAALADGSGAIVTGTFLGSASFGTTTLSATNQLDQPSNDDNMFVASIDADGDWGWAVSVGGAGTVRGESVATFADGSAVVVGSFWDAITLRAADTVSGSAITLDIGVNGYMNEIFAAKISAQGKWEWIMHAGGSGSDFGYGVAAVSDGGAVVTGQKDGDAYVARVDADGQIVWEARGGDPRVNWDDEGTSVAVVTNNGVFAGAIVTGAFDGSATFTPVAGSAVTLTSAGGYSDAFVAKLDATGNWEWAARAGANDQYASDSGAGVGVLTTNGAFAGAIVTGHFTLSATFTPVASAAITLTNTGGSEDEDVFVAKIDAAGNWEWAVSAGSTRDENGTALTVLSDGSAIVTGFHRTRSGYVATFGGVTLPGSGQHRAFVAKVSAAGNWEWAVDAGYTGADPGEVAGRGITLLGSGTVLVTGYFEESAAFGSATLTNTASPGSGRADIFVARLTTSGSFDPA